MVYLQVAVTLALAFQSHAWMNGGDFSKQFEECTGVYNKPSDVNLLTQGIYEKQCTDLLIPLDSSHQRIGNFTDEQMDYIKSLIRKSFFEIFNKMGNRVKRTTKSVWRVREEIRARNGAPFQRYAEAVRRLKKSGEYDVLAQIHTTVVPTAHFGPNFLRWHRLYLFVLETALGCPVPYWDSSEDYVMKKPADSVVWTPKYFGNGYGPVVTGPFAGFKTPIGPLFRKINAYGSLLDRYALIKFVLSKRRMVEISSPTAKPKSNIEGYHNNVHAWVNGLMSNLAYSAFDPVFFVLHSMIDHVYEIFRKQQVKVGIDPAVDFVKTGQKGQSPNDLSRINGFINRLGQSHKLALQVQYHPLSECPFCHGSKDKYCDDYRGVCVSRAAAPHTNVMEGIQIADLIAKKSGLTAGAFGDAFPVFSVDPRTRGDPKSQTQEGRSEITNRGRTIRNHKHRKDDQKSRIEEGRSEITNRGRMIRNHKQRKDDQKSQTEEGRSEITNRGKTTRNHKHRKDDQKSQTQEGPSEITNTGRTIRNHKHRKDDQKSQIEEGRSEITHTGRTIRNHK
ncbi:unnamed protein product [Mytilus coruscus]|uniref:Tyrosinase copper-binding domain-containing protein n=1 Tax=Mytilus coruscus TaxID=42192 RepID=A0A6J8CIC7_MYTCO|nr:unnamed protein product [Mytilus coruscus]